MSFYQIINAITYFFHNKRYDLNLYCTYSRLIYLCPCGGGHAGLYLKL